MARIIYGSQLANLCLLSKDLLNFEPPYRKSWLRPCLSMHVVKLLHKNTLSSWRFTLFEFWYCIDTYLQYIELLATSITITISLHQPNILLLRTCSLNSYCYIVMKMAVVLYAYVSWRF